eukprot:CAMPEP_0198337458 /NCGR_PEP_ID=MMETSP1450-20131203/28648_1 /TAXON_ID=753684 ORGANISM="Madagascaria erythrocladiodes, Strain CCMP3234" /NCGR_SAMPLE_ID=MMETSP1450 /ASSEMBLY_ACC=CAM_ASM_001115 /LENGTH=212 /DNA_ID=CAMNT_0044042263 /DNA_START=83 /DNA_END=721 /DNA_ORIENTATION=-
MGAKDGDVPKLVYFDFAGGRAEHIRQAFEINEAKWEDVRVKSEEFAKEWKPKAPYGSLPVLVVGDEMIAQSVGIMVYAAQQGNKSVWPSDPVAQAKCLSLMLAVEDTLQAAPKSKDKDELKKLREEYAAGALTKFLKGMEATLNDDGYTVGSSITFGDLAVNMVVSALKGGFFDHVPTTIVDGYPRMLKCAANVQANEKVKAFTAKHAKKAE